MSASEAPSPLAGFEVHYLRLEERLGRGGMGEVYRGRDLRLNRRVAVKVLSEEHRFQARSKARFQREARILAHLSHPGLCAIYDLIEAERADYIVMELVEGESLASGTPGMTPARRLDVAIQLAEAIAAAHAAGVVHRDLKPENAMLTREGRVKILDFGVARLDEDTPIPESAAAEPDAVGMAGSADTSPLVTSRGAVLGTLRYMSPEQARGEPATVASDIYSLGVLYHELFAGVCPYADLEPDLLRERVAEARVSLAPELDADLKRLMRDQLHADPRLRPAAEEVAARLRWISAKPERERRRRWRMAGLVVALAALVAAVAAVAAVRRQGRRQAELTRRFAQEASELGWRLRAERLAPAHDLRPVLRELRERISRLERELEALGAAAEGPGFAALGQAELELDDLERAREHFELAWQAGYRSGETAYGLGRTLGELHWSQLKQAALLGDDAERERMLAETRATLREPAIRYLEIARESGVATASYLEGLIALVDERFGDARAKAAEARRARSWLIEADVLEAKANWLEAIRAAYYDKQPQRAEAAFLAALDAFRRAITRGRSDFSAHQGLCRSQLDWVQFVLASQLRGPTPAELEAAEIACSAATELDPDNVDLLMDVEVMWGFRAQTVGLEGGDADPLFAHALEIGDRTVTAAPAQADTWALRAFFHLVRGWIRTLRNGDPLASYEQGLQDIRRARQIAPNRSNLSTLAFALSLRGRYELGRGNDPRPWLEECTRLAAAANTEHERVDYVWYREAECHQMIGIWEARRGDGPEHLDRAIDLWRRVAADPTLAAEQRFLADALNALAAFRIARGLDPSAALTEALATLERGASADSDSSERALYLGVTHLLQAREKMLAGADPATHLEAAAAAFERSVELDPREIRSREHLAATHLLDAEQATGGRRQAALQAARLQLDESDRLFAPFLDTRLDRLQLEILTAREAPVAERSAALRSADRLLAELDFAAASDPRIPLHAAAKEVEEVRWRRVNGAEDTASLARGLAAAERAIELAPDRPEAHAVRAHLLRLAGDPAGALSAWAAACRANPRFMKACRSADGGVGG